MFSRLRDAYLWANAISLYRQKRYEKSRLELSRMARNSHSSSEQYALLATLSLILGDVDEAQSLFVIAAERSNPRKREHRDYIDAYCSYYLNSISGDEGAKVRCLETALRTPASSLIRSWLPLS